MGNNGKWKGIGIMALVLAGLFLIPNESQALPAWARKYGVSCNVCHRPDAPRLSPLGHQFRKLGYRMPEEVGQEPNYKEIGEYIAMRGRARYEYENFAEGKTASTSRFKWNDATLFYGGPVTKNLSAFFEWEWEDSSDISLLGQFSWLMGTPDRYLNLRLGQFHTLTRVGWAGFDRPSGISTPDALSTDLNGSAVPFTVNQDERGLEAAIGLTKDIRVIAQVLNGLNSDSTPSGTSGQESDKDKDILLAYEQNLTERGSGFTIYGYRGVWHSAAGSDDLNQYTFYRLATTGSIVFPTPRAKDLESELQGGLVFAHDVAPATTAGTAAGIADTDGLGYWIGLEQWFHKASIFTRYDATNPNLDPSVDKWSRKYTLGSTYHINDYLRWANEVFLKSKESASDSAGITTEMMFNF